PRPGPGTTVPAPRPARAPGGRRGADSPGSGAPRRRFGPRECAVTSPATPVRTIPGTEPSFDGPPERCPERGRRRPPCPGAGGRSESGPAATNSRGTTPGACPTRGAHRPGPGPGAVPGWTRLVPSALSPLQHGRKNVLNRVAEFALVFQPGLSVLFRLLA